MRCASDVRPSPECNSSKQSEVETMNRMKTRLEQIRQARRIHGGTLKMCAAAVGVKLARMPIPSRLRVKLYRAVYGKKYAALREDQLEQPLAEFRSLNDLFTRGVKREYRPISANREQLLCPCDGTVQDVGTLRLDTLLTAKCIEYPLSALLPGIDTRSLENGKFAIFFLSPADCHRVFSPHEATLREIIHVPGRRLLVHPPFQRKEFPVFSLNERVILDLETPLGRCVLVMVAGWGVGNITHPFPTRLRPRRGTITRERLTEPRKFARGEWLATFELGSTVIMLTEPCIGTVTHIERDAPVLYGRPAFSVPSLVASAPADER